MNIFGIQHKTEVFSSRVKHRSKDSYSNDRVDLNRNPAGSVVEHDLKLYKKAVEQLKAADMEDMPLLNDMPSPDSLKETVRKAVSGEPAHPEDVASFIDDVRSDRPSASGGSTNPADSDIV